MSEQPPRYEVERTESQTMAPALDAADFARTSVDADKLVLAFPKPSAADHATYQITVHRRWAPQHIAIANAALDDEDPRKITRGKLAGLRAAIHSTADPHSVYSKVGSEFIDALESYLPPE